MEKGHIKKDGIGHGLEGRLEGEASPSSDADGDNRGYALALI